jgi:tRNA G10  N-methylase Trm11
MKYVFALGRHPTLSVAELTRAIPGITVESAENGICAANCPELAPEFINKLGGTIKMIVIDKEIGSLGDINAALLRKLIPSREGRIIFGISIYGPVPGIERRRIYIEGLKLKKAIKAEGRRARYVVSQDTQLSSVVITKNKLIGEGAEFVIVKERSRVLVGHTVAVQEFEAYGERDFDRPGRSARRGMLPPKLAQMMVNISGGDQSKTLLDPFCGSGTVLGEALLMGYTDVVGADISAEAVSDTKAYLEWIEKAHPEFHGRWHVFVSDARALDKLMAPESVGAIVTEPFLGPPQNGRETPEQLKRVMNDELVPLYREAIAALSKVLAPRGLAVFSFPVFNRNKGPIFTPMTQVANGLTPAPLIPSEYQEFGLPSTSSGGALYERPDQFVGREIVLLKKV